MNDYLQGYITALHDIQAEFAYRAAHEDVSYKMVRNMIAEMLLDAGSE
jgi:hypothetical protein